jgi:pilus assembly protein Flp/PilA
MRKGVGLMMKHLLAWKEAYLNDEKGATAIEYGLIAGGIALAIAAAVNAFGEDLTKTWENLSKELNKKSN